MSAREGVVGVMGGGDVDDLTKLKQTGLWCPHAERGLSFLTPYTRLRKA